MANACPSRPPLPLRAKSLGKLRLPPRQEARVYGARSLSLASEGVSNGELGEHLGGELAGAQARAGALVLTTGEAGLLLPFGVSVGHLTGVLRERVLRAIASPHCTHEQVLRLRLILVHLDAIGVVAA